MRIRTWVVVAALVAPWLHARDDVPAWMSEAARAAAPAYPPKVTSVVLYNEESTAVSDSGKLTTTTRTAIKFLARQGAASVTFFEQYDKAGGKVRDFRAWTIAASGKVKKYGKEEILDVACADNDVYNECRRRIVSGKADAEPGAVFGYEATVERQMYVGQLAFHFQQTLPVLAARFAVTAPPGWGVKGQSFNGAPREAVVTGSTHVWEMKDLPAIEPEPLSPSVRTLAPWVGVSLTGGVRSVESWEGAAAMLAELNAGTAEPNEALTAKARVLVEGAATELEKIRAIGQFVQQINYVSIQVDLAKGGGYRPHPAVEVFEKRYGDCKDKANLMRAMLKAAGIEALPVAIYAGDRTHVQREWPSLGVFNHAISAIKVSPQTKAPAVLDHPRLGRLLFFDPTDPHVPVGYLPAHEQGSLALVAGAGPGGLVEVPAAPARASERRRTVEAVLGEDGTLTGTFLEQRTGSGLSTARSLYRGMQRPDYTAWMERWIARGVPGAVTTGIEVRDEDEAFTVEARFASPRFGQAPQQRMLVFRAAPLRHAEPNGLNTTRKRVFPVAMEADALEETVRIATPAGSRVDELPPPVSVESEFGRYRARWAVEAGAVVFEQRLEVEARTVPAERYEELRRFLNVAYGAAGRQVVLLR